MQRKLYQLIVLLLVALFTYTACSKWFDFMRFKGEMLNQPFARWLAWVLIYTLPVLELGIAAALLFDRSRKWALLASLLSLLAFTVYAMTILLGGFHRIPCSCGGLIAGLTWTQHALFTLALSVASYWSLRFTDSKLYMYNRGS